MTYFSSKKHDIGIVRSSDSSEVGLMLATEKDRDGNDVPLYRTIYDSYLVDQYTTSPDFGATNPQKELHITGGDFRSGAGQYIYDSNDPKRYFESIGCDLRWKSGPIAGWTSTAIPYKYTWTTPSSTTDPDVAWTNDANAIDDNTATTAYDDVGTTGWTKYLEFNTTSATVGALKYYVDSTSGQNAQVTKIDIDIYYGSAWHAVHDEQTIIKDQWVIVEFTPQAGVTACRIRLLMGAGVSYVAHFNELDFAVRTSGVDSVVFRDASEFNDRLYIAGDATLYRLDLQGSGLIPVKTLPATITDLEPFTDDKLYICQGIAAAYWQMTTAEKFTINTLANNYMQYMATVFTTADTMYGNDAVNKIRSTTNPADGGTAWSAQTIVGASYHNIQGLFDNNGALYIPKEDMPYYLDSTPSVQKDAAPELASLTSSTSGKNTDLWQGNIYYPAGAQALLEIGTSNTWRTPAEHFTNSTTFNGRVAAVTHDDQFLFAIMNGSSVVQVLACRNEVIDSTTKWVVHPIHQLAITACETAWTSSVFQKRLYIASSTAGEGLYYMPLPTGYANMPSDTNRAFKTDSYFITPWHHGGFKGINKSFTQMTATLGHTYSENYYFECWYQALGGSWTDIGDLKGSATSMIATLYNATPPVSTLFRFKFVIKILSGTTVTPELVNFDAKMIVRPTARNVIECAVRCADGILDKEGDSLQGVDAAIIRTVIEEAQDTAAPITFYDIWGNTKYVIVMSREPFSEVVKNQVDESLEEVFYLRLQIVDLA